MKKKDNCMKKKDNWIRRFFRTRVPAGVIGILLVLYFLGAAADCSSIKSFLLMYVDVFQLGCTLMMAALLIYLGRMEKAFFGAWRLAFSKRQGISRMELQEAVNAMGYAEKAVLLTEIALSMFSMVDFFYHQDNAMTGGPAFAVICTGILYLVLLLLILLPVKVRLERMLICYMQEPEDSEQERNEADVQKLYFRLRSLGLTDRETEVARLAASGMRNEEIGRELYISTATVKKHMTHILEKMQCGDRETLGERIRGL